MSAIIYDFMTEKVKRETPELLGNSTGENMLFIQVHEMPPMVGEDAIDRILKDLGIELKKDD